MDLVLFIAKGLVLFFAVTALAIILTVWFGKGKFIKRVK